MDSLRIAPGCKLTIEAGTQVYSRNGAKLMVEGTLDMQGTAEKRVILADFRQVKDNAPGQWGGIVFKETSRSNSIKVPKSGMPLSAWMYRYRMKMPCPTLQ
jgi:hypothetical protein